MHRVHDDVIKWKHFPRYWPFVRGIPRSPVNSPHKGQWRGALVFSLTCARINGWVNNREAGDLRRNRAHYDVIVVLQYDRTRLHFVCIRLHFVSVPSVRTRGWGLYFLIVIETCPIIGDSDNTMNVWQTYRISICIIIYIYSDIYINYQINFVANNRHLCHIADTWYRGICIYNICVCCALKNIILLVVFSYHRAANATRQCKQCGAC